MEIGRCSVCGEFLGDYAVHSEYFRVMYGTSHHFGKLEGFICKDCVIKNSKIKKFYHLTTDLDKIDKFVPRIPENRHYSENDNIDRISVSSSIEGCLSATPWGGIHLEDLFDFDSYYTSLIRVYEFNINSMDLQNIIPPEYLFQEDLVRDADITKEHWIIKQDLIPTKSYLIKLRNFREETEDDIAYDDYVSIYYDTKNYDDCMQGCFTSIVNIEYEVVSERKRTKIFKLNHIIEDLAEEDISDIETTLCNLYPQSRTHVWIEYDTKLKKHIIRGELDTRINGERDKLTFIDVLNEQLSKGVIIQVPKAI